MKIYNLIVGGCNFSSYREEDFTTFYYDKANALQLLFKEKIIFKAVDLFNKSDDITFVVDKNNIFYSAYNKLVKKDYLMKNKKGQTLEFSRVEDKILVTITDPIHENDEVEYIYEVDEENNEMFDKFKQNLNKIVENYYKIHQGLIEHINEEFIKKYDDDTNNKIGYVLRRLMDACIQSTDVKDIINYDMIFTVASLAGLISGNKEYDKPIIDYTLLKNDFFGKYFSELELKMMRDALLNYTNPQVVNDNMYLNMLRLTTSEEINESLSYLDVLDREEVITEIKEDATYIEELAKDYDIYLKQKKKLN